MEHFLELVKDIAAVVGCVSAVAGLITAICKPLRKRLVNFIKRQAGSSEITEIKTMLEQKIAEDKERDSEIKEALAITTEFTEKQCRNIIKNIFYHYKDTKTLPLYERKTLMDIEELYIDRMHKNHWGQTLINEMKKWNTDCSGDDFEAGEEE